MELFGNAWRAFYVSMAAAAALSAQTFTTLVNFDLTNGAAPARMAMVPGLDGNLYGTTSGGGSAQAGTVFKITPSGILTTLHSFVGSDGSVPLAGSLLATDGNFYGTTSEGGTNGFGTVFKMTPDGTITTLFSFCPQFDCFAGANAGANPSGALIQGTSGELYGTTTHGGSSTNCSTSGVIGCGTVFKISPSGVLATMHSFEGTDGLLPMGALVEAANGNFYGTTSQGGVVSQGTDGTVFEITPGGHFTTIQNLNAANGAFPFSALIQAANGYLYGTTAIDGTSVGGTAFRLSKGGTFTTIHNFDGTDGFWPSTLIQAGNGDFSGSAPPC